MVGFGVDCEYFDILVKYSSDLTVVVDQAGYFTYTSDAVFNMLGYDSEELIGSLFFNYFHPEDKQLAKIVFEAMSVSSCLKVPVFRFKAKNGEWKLLEISTTNLLHHQSINGYIINVRDVTEKQLTNVYYQQNNSFYQSLFYNHPDAVFALTTDGHFSHTNESAGKITGYASGQLTGVHYSNIVHASFSEEIKQAFETALKGTACTVEGKILKKNDVAGDFTITLVPVLIRGDVVSIQGIAKEITAIRQANELVRDYAKQLHNILESITEAFFEIDASGNLTYLNSVFAQYFKKPQQNLQGHNLWKMLPALLATDFYKKCGIVLQNGESVSCSEYVHAFKAYLNFNIYATKNGLAVCFSDITEQKKAQQELEQLSLVASKTTNGVIITDADGAIEWVNEGFTRLTGYSSAEVIGQKPGCFLQGFDTNQEAVDEMRRLLTDRQPFTTEVLNYTKSGEKIWIALEVTPVYDKNGGIARYMAIQSDITAHKNAEEHLLQLTDDLYRQNRELQQFSYIVSHNLHSPVANAKGLANLLRRVQPDSESFNKALGNMELTIDNLSMVIQDLSSILDLRYAKSVSATVNVASVVKEVLQSMPESIVSSEANVQLSIADSISLQANKAYLYSVIHNLVSNAIKFRASTRTLEIAIDATQLNNETILTVKDNGIGMDLSKVQANLFKLYKRFHPEKEGRGLGLYMVKTQVEALGGIINVESKLGSGTTFTIKFNNASSNAL